MPAEETKIAVLENEMKHLNLTMQDLGNKIDALHSKLDDNYIKKSDFASFYSKEFEPIKNNVEKINLFYIKIMAVASAVTFTFLYLPGVLKQIIQTITK